MAIIKGYDEQFINWLNNCCYFSSTLVDRIVPGYPKDNIQEITEELGYIDNNVVKCEIFHLWVLAKQEHVMKAFPCDQVGLNVIYADSIKPYKQRKVKILNGCHTCMVPVSYLYGIDTVKESIEDEVVGKFAREFVFDEVVPTIELPKDQMIAFANSVFERYLNPFVRHELMSIALNSISNNITQEIKNNDTSKRSNSIVESKQKGNAKQRGRKKTQSVSKLSFKTLDTFIMNK